MTGSAAADERMRENLGDTREAGTLHYMYMYEVASCVLSNAYVSVPTLSRLECVCRDFRELAKERKASIRAGRGLAPPVCRTMFPIDGRRTSSSSSSACAVCHASGPVVLDRFEDRFVCTDHLAPTVSRTDAKRTYKLKDSDLAAIDVLHAVVRVRRGYVNAQYHSLRDVIGACFVKHGVTHPDEIVAGRGRGEAVAAKRREQLRASLEAFVPVEYRDRLAESASCKRFLRNGDGGVRALRKWLGAWTEFEAFWRFDDTLGSAGKIAAFEEFAKAGGAAAIVSRHENVLAKRDRRRDLPETVAALVAAEFPDLDATEHAREYAHTHAYGYTRAHAYLETGELRHLRADLRQSRLRWALQEHGLTLRTDSDVCAQYVDGRRTDLEEVVRVMREMDFFFSETAYRTFVAETYRSLRPYRRRHRYDHDYETDSSDDDDDVDRVQVSRNAKVRALTEFRGVVPDFVARDLVAAADAVSRKRPREPRAYACGRCSKTPRRTFDSQGLADHTRCVHPGETPLPLDARGEPETAASTSTSSA